MFFTNALIAFVLAKESLGLLADHACPPYFENRILVRRRTLVVLLAPDKVPDGCDEEEGEEDDRSVVHELGYNGNGRRHAEQWDRKSGPSYESC